MGASAVAIAQEPLVEVEFADPTERTSFGPVATVSCTVLNERPPHTAEQIKLQKLFSKTFDSAPAFDVFQMRPLMAKFDALGPDPRELADYKKEIALVQRLGFSARNAGRVLVEDVRIILEVPKAGGVKLIEELPARPLGRTDFALAVQHRSSIHTACSTLVRDLGSSWEIVSRFDKIQPNTTVWSEPFWVGSKENQVLKLVAKVSGDTIPRVIEIPLTIYIRVKSGYLDEDADDEPPSDDE